MRVWACSSWLASRARLRAVRRRARSPRFFSRACSPSNMRFCALLMFGMRSSVSMTFRAEKYIAAALTDQSRVGAAAAEQGARPPGRSVDVQGGLGFLDDP